MWRAGRRQPPGKGGASACPLAGTVGQRGPGVRRTPPHTGCLWSSSAQHRPPHHPQVTPIVSTWVLALGRVLENTSPGPCRRLSPPGWHAQGSSLGGHRGQGRGWAAPPVWPGPGPSALWATDSHLQWGWAAQPHLHGPWEQGGTPPPQLTGGQGCHGGGDQALDSQGAEGATQEAAGEGQELGAGDTGHHGQSRGRPTPRGHMGLSVHSGVKWVRLPLPGSWAWEEASAPGWNHARYLGCFLQVLQTRGHPDEEGKVVVLQDVGPLGTEEGPREPMWHLYLPGGGREGRQGPSAATLRSGRTLPTKWLWSVLGRPSRLYEDPWTLQPGPGVLPSTPLLHDFQGARWGEDTAQAIRPPVRPSVGA